MSEQLCPEVGLHMVCEVLPVVFQNAGAGSDSHLREGHPTLLGQVDALIGVYILTELVSQFLLSIGIDVEEDRTAVGLVAYHDAVLPAAILSFAYHAVTGWSALLPPLVK